MCYSAKVLSRNAIKVLENTIKVLENILKKKHFCLLQHFIAASSRQTAIYRDKATFNHDLHDEAKLAMTKGTVKCQKKFQKF